MPEAEAEKGEGPIPAILKHRRALVGLAAILCLILLVVAFTWNASVYVVTLDVQGEREVLSTRASTVADLLAEAEIKLNDGDLVQPAPAELLQTGMVIRVHKAFPVTVIHDEKERLIYTTAEDVESLLTEAGIYLGINDRVKPAMTAALEEGAAVKVTRVREELVTEEKPLPFKREVRRDATLPYGQEKLLQQGKDGQALLTYKIIYEDGKKVDKELINEEVKTQPTARIVVSGTKLVTASRSWQVVDVFQGTACWYGGKFHGRRTASGETFDKNAYTAAHRTLPFGTNVRVTYLKTGRSVIVRINDRGPFVEGRIIDLSEAAAEAIGLRSAGIGTVKVEVLK